MKPNKEGSEFRTWVIYGDNMDHPNGYKLQMKTLNFESGPLIDVGEKVEVIDKRAYNKVLSALREAIEALEKYANFYHGITCEKNPRKYTMPENDAAEALTKIKADFHELFEKETK